MPEDPSTGDTLEAGLASLAADLIGLLADVDHQAGGVGAGAEDIEQRSGAVAAASSASKAVRAVFSASRATMHRPKVAKMTGSPPGAEPGGLRRARREVSVHFGEAVTQAVEGAGAEMADRVERGDLGIASRAR